MVTKVIPLSRCSHCDEDEGRDFEAWEEYVELFERGDFPGLIRLYEADLRRWPDDVNTHCELGDAYVRNGQPQRAMDFLAPRHRADPEQTAYHYAILDALCALGRTEKDFDWVVAPRVYRLGPEVLDACFRYLSGKRRPRRIFELTGEVTAGGYQAFSEDELLAALRRDVRFVVEPGIGFPGVSVARDGPRSRSGGGRGRGRNL